MEISNKYVGYCDILGFSNAVISKFDETIKVYTEFRKFLSFYKIENITISIYSDSIMVVGDTLFNVAEAIQILHLFTLRDKWLIRGGIAYGKHWKESDENNLFIVSEALVKAVAIEKEIRYPIIAVSEEINIDFNYWISVLNRQYGEWPIIYFDKKNIVNPMCKYWFKSAIVQLNGLKSQYPEHFAKYNYLLNIFDDMNLQKPIFPKDSLDDLVKNGVLKRINLK